MVLEHDQFSTFAECILYEIPIDLLSPFIDAIAEDMKSLKELTLGRIERLDGILLKDIDRSEIFPVIYRSSSGKLEKHIAVPVFPDNLHTWSQIIKNLAFIIGDLSSFEPIHFLSATRECSDAGNSQAYMPMSLNVILEKAK